MLGRAGHGAVVHPRAGTTFSQVLSLPPNFTSWSDSCPVSIPSLPIYLRCLSSAKSHPWPRKGGHGTLEPSPGSLGCEWGYWALWGPITPLFLPPMHSAPKTSALKRPLSESPPSAGRGALQQLRADLSRGPPTPGREPTPAGSWATLSGCSPQPPSPTAGLPVSREIFHLQSTVGRAVPGPAWR